MSARPIGLLRQRVALEAPLDTPDDSGALERIWMAKAVLWAQISPQHGAENFAAGEQQTTITHDVTIRWRSDVASPMRFSFGSRILLLQSAFDPDGRKRILTCRCVEFVA